MQQVLALGGNAVLGFQLCFDVEGDSGIVVRAHGTAAAVVAPPSDPTAAAVAAAAAAAAAAAGMGGGGEDDGGVGAGVVAAGGMGPMASPVKRAPGTMADHTADLEAAAQQLQLQQQRRQHRRRRRRGEGEDVVVLTLMEFDPRARLRLGGLVTAKSVKYLGKLASKKADEASGLGLAWVDLVLLNVSWIWRPHRSTN
jgi:hypothetical protein